MAASVETGAVTPTANPYLDTLIIGDRYTSGPVTFHFDDGGANGTADDWQPWAKDALRSVFDTYSDYVNLDFQEVNDQADANIILRMDTLDEIGATARFGYPDGDDAVAVGRFPYDWSRWTDWHLEKGGYAYHTVLHEVGHGLGLEHPHGSGGLAGTPFPGVDDAADSGDFGLNNGIYTVMSYLDHSQFWAPIPATSDLGWGYAGTPMAFDIAALQVIYGARSKNAGNDVYDLPDLNGDGTYWESIYDSGGYDLMRYTGSLDATLDLRPAHYGLGEGAGGYLSNVEGIAGGFTIAHGTALGAVNRIEAAQGGDGDDTIVGNEAENTLDGGGGHDSMLGGNGDDTLIGGDGNDTMEGGGHFDDYHGGAGDDVYRIGWQDEVFEAAAAGTDSVFIGLDYALTVNLENLHLTGNGNIDGTGNAEDNVIVGNGGANGLEGLYGDDTVNGQSGDDSLDGGTGSDSLSGGHGDDLIDGGDDEVLQLGFNRAGPVSPEPPGPGLTTNLADARGPAAPIPPVLEAPGGDDQGGSDGGLAAFGFADTLRGGSGDDTLLGRGGNDLLFGQWNDDRLVGDAGNDTMDGGAGADTMVGGTGSDTYYVDDIGDHVSEAASGGVADQVLSSIDYGLTGNVENLGLTGTADIDGAGNGLDNDVVGNGGDNRLMGRAGDDLLSGGAGEDTLNGGSGDDALYGGPDDDVLIGRRGNDSVAGGTGEDTMKGGAGNDTLSGGDDADTAKGGRGEDWLFGGQGEDSLSGGADTDALFGGAGADTLKGGRGGDFITGGFGDDDLHGNGHDDAFLFEGRFGHDTIHDFRDGDVLWFIGFGTELDNLGEVLARTTTADGSTTIDLTDVEGGIIHLLGFDDPLNATDLDFLP